MKKSSRLRVKKKYMVNRLVKNDNFKNSESR